MADAFDISLCMWKFGQTLRKAVTNQFLTTRKVPRSDSVAGGKRVRAMAQGEATGG